MMIDYKNRYQTIKDKGEKLSLNISSYLKKDYFLFFNNNYYSNFREIPLEDFINIKKTKEDKGYFPILSKTFEGIEPIQEGEEYYPLGYKITKYLRTEDNTTDWDTDNLEKMTKERENLRQYLPLELSYLFNTHNEGTIEETLTRYIKTLFNSPIEDEELIKKISKSFNEYALVFNIAYGGGYLLHPEFKAPTKDIIFKHYLSFTILLEKGSLEAIEEQIKEDRRKILESSGDEELIAHWGGYSPEEEKEGRNISLNIFKTIHSNIKKLVFRGEIPENSVIYEDLAYKEIIKQTPHKTEKGEDAIYPLTLTNSEDSYLRFMCMYLNAIISNTRIVAEKKRYIEALESILQDEESLKTYSKIYKYLLCGENKTYNKPQERVELEETSHYTRGNEPFNEIMIGLNLTTSVVNRQDEIDYVYQYQQDSKRIEELKTERERLNTLLKQALKENNQKDINELETLIQKITDEIDNYKIEERGKGNFAPYGYFFIGDIIRRVNNPILQKRVYQINSSQSVMNINENTNFVMANDIMGDFTINNVIYNVFAFLTDMAILKNNFEFEISNEEIEKFILGDKYTNASLKMRDNARNQIFLSAVKTLAEISITTSYKPTENAKRQGATPRAKGGGSVLEYHNNWKSVYIRFNKNLYEIVIGNFPNIPLHKNIYDLSPRAFRTCFELCRLFAYNVREENRQQRITIKKLVDINGYYATNLKYLKKNKERFIEPILDDFQEMLEKKILLSYSPKKVDYFMDRASLSLESGIFYKLNLKPQTTKKKADK